ncbi:EAL domain-containing protein [Chitinibacteraceae bacterium HSL-7]
MLTHLLPKLSLQSRLVVGGALLQFVLLGSLGWFSFRQTDELLVNWSAQRVMETGQLLSASLQPVLAKGDRAGAAELSGALRASSGIDYLVLTDRTGKLIAAHGWDPGRPLPKETRLLSGLNVPPVVHVQRNVELQGQLLAKMAFGMTTDLARESESRQHEQVLWVLAAMLAISCAVLWLLSKVFRRHLARLLERIELAVASDYHALDPRSGGLADLLAQRFNAVAAQVRERLRLVREQERKLHAIADYTFSTELWLDPQGKLVWVNAAVCRLTGYTVDECMRLPDFPLSLVSADERMRVADVISCALTARSTGRDFEFRAIRRDGSEFWAAMSWQPILAGDGEYLGLRASVRDNSELKDDRLALHRAVIELRQSQMLGHSYLQRADSERARLTALLSAMRFGVLFADHENRVVYHNPAFLLLWGLARDEQIIDRPLVQVLQRAHNRPVLGGLTERYLRETPQADDRVDYGEITMNDGRILTQQCYRVRDDDGGDRGRMWVYEDVTLQRQLSERMTALAERDALTGLFNRHRFQQELERMVSEANRRQVSMALLFFDLDEFKHVNDTFGHGAGDDLLKAIADEVGGQVRRHEVFARLGGDEFAVLVPECSEIEVGRLAERIVARVADVQFRVSGHILRPTSSVGVAMLPQHASTPEELVAHADAAMYQAKAAGKATWRMYRSDADSSRSAITRLSWKERVINALEHDGFVLYFQGIYDTSTRELRHLEALVRMKDPERPGEVIPPGLFIGHAEKTGKIIDIDRWVIRRTIELLARYPAVSIAINISGRSFDEVDLPAYIGQLLRDWQVDPQRLLVELTETAAVSDIGDAQRFIDALHETGCPVCLDDFGNGFASFAYLKQLKADVLKIDGLFIRDLPNDSDSQIFVRGMVEMARAMGKTTIAEFVETEAIYRMLVEFGVDQVQGYYLDKPEPHHPGLISPGYTL